MRGGVSSSASRTLTPSAAPASTPTCWKRILRGWAFTGTRAAATAAPTAPITRASAQISTPPATKSWLHSPQFIVGTILFFTGMAINIQSDHIVRHLRKPGDTNHYLPKKGLFKYVTSANYFGEIVEWCGFAILTWSASGAVFAWWTFANLVPRANTIYHKYKAMFGNELENRKRVIPFIY